MKAKAAGLKWTLRGTVLALLLPGFFGAGVAQNVALNVAQNAAASSAPNTTSKAIADAIPDNVSEAALPGLSARQFEGHTVESIRVLGVSPVRESELLGRITLKTGQPLSRAALSQSLRLLYEGGRFEQIEAAVTVLPTGALALEFRTRPNYFNGLVTATGLPKGGPSDVQAVNMGRLELGAIFSQVKLDESARRILRLMHDHGYWKAEVHAHPNRHEDTQQVDVEFQVTAGEPAHVGHLTVTGDPGLKDDEAAAICRMAPGKRVKGDLLPRAVTRLRRRYVKQQRLRAQITAGVPVFHAETNTVDYSFQIERGPVVDVRAEGVTLSPRKLRHLVPVYEEHAVDEDLLNEGRRNLRDYLQVRGYFDSTAQVRQEDDTAHDAEHIIYQVQAGHQHRVRAVVITGNHRFELATLRERIATQASSPRQPRGRYSQTTLTSDAQSLRSLYQANGYPQVKVTSQVEDNYGEKGGLRVTFHIEEGPLVKVRQLNLHGAASARQLEIRRILNTSPGQPFAEATIAEDREVVLNNYFNRGFAGVQVETTAHYADDAKTQMDVTFEINEGPPSFVNQVLVNGVVHTKPHIVNRAIVIHPGQPLSQERILQTQRNLYDLGIFNEVQTAIQNPEGDEAHKDVLLQLTEAKRWTVNYGGGIEAATGLNVSQGGSAQGATGVSPRVTLDVTRINLGGRDQSLIFRSHFGLLQKRASLTFEQPRWFDLPNWRFALTGLYDNTRDVNTYSSERVEGSVQLTEKISKATQLLYRFAYRRIKVDPNSFPAGFSADLIPFYSQPVRVGMPSFIVVRDTRDNPLESTKGTYNTIELGAASGYFGSEANFGRILAQNASYYKLGRNWVLARSIRIGVEMPYGAPCSTISTTTGACPTEVKASGYVPLPERFFVGGSNSHRGFAINQAGPRDPDSGAPLGGNAMFVNNIELRLPPVPLALVHGNLSFVLFHDIGNAFGTANEMWKNLDRFSQRNQASCRDLSLTATCDFSYMSQAVGVGVRYHTPLGPVRVDFGYNLNPPTFPVKDPCSGVTGTCTSIPNVEEVHHFNFYFSLGQTF